MKKQKKETNKPLRIGAKDVGSSENQIRLLSDKINNLSSHFKKNKNEQYLHYHLIGTGCTMWVCWQIATLSGIVLGSFVPAELGLKFAIPLTFIAIVVQDLKKIDHVIVMITCGLSSLLFFDAPFKSYIIISPVIALFVASLILRLKK